MAPATGAVLSWGAAVVAGVRTTNAVAIDLYARYGFRAAGLRRRYYQDNGEDAIIMWRTPATLADRGDPLADVPGADSATA